MFDGVLNPDDKSSNRTRETSRLHVVLPAGADVILEQPYFRTARQLNARATRTSTPCGTTSRVTTHVSPVLTAFPANMAYAIACGSRYLTRDNPKLDEKTAYNVSPFVVLSGLLPTDFYNPVMQLSFNSSKTPSHNTQPGQNSFS